MLLAQAKRGGGMPYLVSRSASSLLAGVLSWHLVEKNFIRRKSYDPRAASRAEQPRPAKLLGSVNVGGPSAIKITIVAILGRVQTSNLIILDVKKDCS